MINPALLVSLPRAAESQRLAQGRVFGDPWACELLPGGFRRALKLPGVGHLLERVADTAFPGSFTSLLLRNRYFDAAFADAVLKRGVQQTVVLGAGLDTIALRHRGLCQAGPCRILEVDLPKDQRRKESMVKRAWGEVPSWLSFVPHDLSTGDLAKKLVASGLTPGVPTLVLAEGVFPYLSGADVVMVLEELLPLLGPGDQIVASVIPLDMPGGNGGSHNGRRVQRLTKRLKSPLKWGCERVQAEELARRLGVDLVEMVDVKRDLAPRYLYGDLLDRPVADTTEIIVLAMPGQAPKVTRGFRRRRGGGG